MTSSRTWSSRGVRAAASGSATVAGRVEMRTSQAAAAAATARISDHITCSTPTPRRDAAAITEPGPPKRRAATVVVVIPSSPRAANADEAVARAPRTRALVGSGTPAWSQARLIAEAMPATSVLNPASNPAEGTTVLTAPTALASGSMASSSPMIACLHGIVTDRPRKESSRPAMKAGRVPSSTSQSRYSQPSIPSWPQAARWITGESECEIGEPMTPAQAVMIGGCTGRRGSCSTRPASPCSSRDRPRWRRKGCRPCSGRPSRSTASRRRQDSGPP